MRKIAYFILATFLGGVIFTSISASRAQNQPGGPSELPPAREIPGITAADRFPRACIDCHINYSDMNLDTRISTLLAQWSEGVEPAVLEAARSVTDPTIDLSGVHPRVDAALNDIPAACLGCHQSDTDDIPPLVPLLHKIHLGSDGVFLSVFQGECTHCHKLDEATGQWHVPSGPEE